MNRLFMFESCIEQYIYLHCARCNPCSLAKGKYTFTVERSSYLYLYQETKLCSTTSEIYRRDVMQCEAENFITVSCQKHPI